jgi:hypothetical protein
MTSLSSPVIPPERSLLSIVTVAMGAASPAQSFLLRLESPQLRILGTGVSIPLLAFGRQTMVEWIIHKTLI